MGDLIDRQEAIDALEKMSANYGKIGRREWHPHIEECKSELRMLPSAQPKRTETHACDLISRQATITAIQKAYADTEGGTDKCAVWKNVGLTSALHIMQDLPSAQPVIIMCQDCKNWDVVWWNDGTLDYHYCTLADKITEANFYCADGERKEDG